jgi:hypothetical protein
VDLFVWAFIWRSCPCFCCCLQAAGGIGIGVFMACLVLLTVVVRMSPDWYLSKYWTKEVQAKESSLLSQRATVAASGGDPSTISLRVDQRSYVQVYAILIAVLVVMRLSEGWLFARIAIQAARRLHNINFIRVLNGTMAYFDTTPLGRILNRFAGFVHLSLA